MTNTNTNTASGSADDSLLLCASDLQHSAIYDNHVEMQACIRAVANRIAALASAAAPAEQPSDLNLNCKSVQKRLATQWGFVPAMMYLELTDAMGYDSGEDGVTWSPEEWAAHLYAFYKSKTAPAQPGQEGEPVAWLSTDSIGERYLCFTKPNDSDPVRPLVFGDTTPQPTQAQAGAVPLTDKQIRAMAREYPAEDLCGWSYRMGVADTESHHGIKGGQHGTE